MSKHIVRYVLAALGLGAVCSRVEAFIMIDTAGPREIISPMSFEPVKDAGKDGALHSQAIKLSTKDKALTAFALRHEARRDPPAPAPGVFPATDVYTFGTTLKLQATNGVEDFFKFERWPDSELGVLCNWTSFPGGAGVSGAIKSLTLHAGANRTEISYVPKTGNPMLKKVTDRDTSGFASLTGGLYWRNVPIVGQLSLVLSGEVRRQSNVDELPKVTTAELTNLGPTTSGTATRVLLEKSAVVRWGDLERATTVPVTVAAVLTQRADWVGRLFTAGETRLFWAPYYRVTTVSHGGTARAGGMNVTVRIKSDKGALSYPLSLFVERGNEFGQSERKTTVGASTVFSWGP